MCSSIASMPQRSARCARGRERFAICREPGGVERGRRGFARACGNCGRRHRRPAAVRGGISCHLPTVAPTSPCAPRARAGSRPASAAPAGARERASRRARARSHVVVKAEATRRDAALRGDGRGLDREHPGAGQQHLSPVDQMPVGRAAVVRRVLAHRRDDDAVRQRQRRAAQESESHDRPVGATVAAAAARGRTHRAAAHYVRCPRPPAGLAPCPSLPR